MTKLLEQAVEAVRRLPADAQDKIARTILHLAGNEVEPEPIEPGHPTAVLEGLAQARRREFATDEEVAAALRRFDRRSYDSRRVRREVSLRLRSICVRVIHPRRLQCAALYCVLSIT